MNTAQPQPITKVAIVGGPSSIVTTLTTRLAEHQISVLAHLGETKSKQNTVTNIPKGTEGVIALVDTCSHLLTETAKSTAKKAGVPYIGVPRHWSKAEPILRSQGFLPPSPKRKAKISPSDIENVALTYVCEERAKGRVPKFAEVEAVIQRAYGPDTALPKVVFDNVHSRAAASIPVHTEGVPESVNTIIDWTQALIEDRPERMLDLGALVVTVQKDTKTTLPPVRVGKIVGDVVNHLKVRFSSRGVSEDVEWRNKIFRAWIVRQFDAWKEGKIPYPKERYLNEHLEKIFGRKWVPYALVPEARAESLGEWSRDLIKTRVAHDYFVEKTGKETFYEEFMELLLRGEIKNLDISNRWFTSTLAIDEYLKDSTSKVEEPAPKEVDDLKAGTAVTVGPIDIVDIVDPKHMAETVALEALTLFEGMLVKKLAPITDQIKGLVASVEQSHKIVIDRIEAVENSTVISKEWKRDLVEALKEALKPVAGLPKDLMQVGSKVEGLYGATKKVQDVVESRTDNLRMNQEAILARLDEMEGDLIDVISQSQQHMTLRGLGEMARDTGLQITIKTPPPGKG